MAQTTIRLPVTKWAIVQSNYPSEVIDASSLTDLEVVKYTDGTAGGYIFAGFQPLQSNLSRNRIISATFMFNYRSGGSKGDINYSTRMCLDIAERDFDPAVLCWTNRMGRKTQYYYVNAYWNDSWKDVLLTQGGDTLTDAQRSEAAAIFLSTHTSRIYAYNSGGKNERHLHVHKTLGDGTTLPYVEVTYDSVKVGSQIKNNRFVAYVDPRNNNTVNWFYDIGDSSGYHCIATEVVQTSATFYWREQGADSWNNIAVSGNTKQVTIPANTFPTKKTIECYIEGTDDQGFTSQTQVQTFSTAAPLIISTPISPINTIEDGSLPIKLRWAFSSSDGRLPSRYFLYWKMQGETVWKTLYSPGAGVIGTEYDVPADTFPAGTIVWGVQAANVDGVGGQTGSATFVCRAAPVVSGLTSNGVPFLTVSWQADGQYAYEVTVDEKVYGPYFGEEKSFTLPDYLEDGDHTVQARILGAWNLWSSMESLQVTIQNVAGEDIALTGSAGTDNFLSWATEEKTADFIIYRNGKAIAHTVGYSFFDRFAGGTASYRVVNRLQSGNYSISNEEVLTSDIDGTHIGLLSGGEWLEIKYSRNDQRDPTYEQEAESIYNHLAGDAYPSAVVSGYKENTVSFSALFLCDQEEERLRFESMFGKPVLMKFRDGTVIAAVLNKWTKTVRKKYWTEYSYTLQRIELEDYVDDTT